VTMGTEENKDARLAARRLLGCIEILRKADPDMPIVSAAVLLSIAVNEGTTQRDIATSLQIPTSTTSRTIAVLSNVKRIGKQGLELVSWYDDPNDRRTKRLLLSPKGRSLIKKLVETV